MMTIMKDFKIQSQTDTFAIPTVLPPLSLLCPTAKIKAPFKY